MLGELCIKRKDYVEAEQHVRETLKAEPNDAKSHHNLATLYGAQQRYDDAVNEYRTAIKLDPKLEVSYKNLAHVLLGQNRREEAVAALKSYCELKPLDVDELRALADVYRDLGHRQEALDVLDKIVIIEAENFNGGPESIIAAAKVRWDMGDKKGAISDLEAQIEKHPSEAASGRVRRSLLH